MNLTPWLIIIALILLNGLFVAAEFAVVGAPRALIERRAARGDRLARRVLAILHDPVRQDRYIATAQLGITLASLGLGMYGEHVLAGWLAGRLEALGTSRWIAAHSLASFLAIAVLTYFHIVVGEMVPKSLALSRAEQSALWVSPFVSAVTLIFYPLIRLLNALGAGLLKRFGIAPQSAGHEQFLTPQELQFVVQESQEEGLLRGEAGHVLLDLFEFGDRSAGEVMVPRVNITGIPVGTTPEALRTLLRTSRHTRYPIYEGDLDHILGVIHIKDLLRRMLDARPIGRADARPTTYLPETSTLDTVLRTMRRERTQMVVVMDEHGGTAGLITLEDLFEEVVGDIEEAGGGTPEMFEDAEGLLHVVGTVRLDEVGERIGQVLEHEEVDTVSGLVLALLERAPAVGDVVVYDGVRFEVTGVAGHGVKEAVVRVEGEGD
jgi:CBS domain containing-hemolysin-like protein